MKNLKFTFRIILWLFLFLFSLCLIYISVRSIFSSEFDTWRDIYYYPNDLDRDFLVIGVALFFLSITAPILFAVMNRIFNKVTEPDRHAISNIKMLKGLSLMWSVLLVLGLSLMSLSFLIDLIIKKDYGPSPLSWYLFIQGFVLVVMGLFVYPLLCFFKTEKTSK